MDLVDYDPRDVTKGILDGIANAKGLAKSVELVIDLSFTQFTESEPFHVDAIQTQLAKAGKVSFILSHTNVTVDNIGDLAMIPSINGLVLHGVPLDDDEVISVLGRFGSPETGVQRSIDLRWNGIVVDDRLVNIFDMSSNSCVRNGREDYAPRRDVEFVYTFGPQFARPLDRKPTRLSVPRSVSPRCDVLKLDAYLRNQIGFRWTDLVITAKPGVSPIPMEYIADKVVSLIPDWMLQTALKQSVPPSVTAPFPSLQLKKFGSCVSGFGSKSSDVDLVVVAVDPDGTHWLESAFRSADAQKELSQNFLWYLQQLLPEVLNCELVRHARIPVLKISAFPVSSSVSVSVDITFLTSVCLINTHLLHQYAVMNEHIFQLGHMVKMWAKSNNLISKEANGHSFPSAYAWVLISIYFVQCRMYACLSLVGPRRGAKPRHIWGCRNGEYVDAVIKDPGETRAVWEASEHRQRLPRSPVSLFAHFLRFVVDDLDRVVIDLREVATSSRDAVITVMDPIEIGRVVTKNVTHEAWTGIKTVALAALSILAETPDVDTLITLIAGGSNRAASVDGDESMGVVVEGKDFFVDGDPAMEH